MTHLGARQIFVKQVLDWLLARREAEVPSDPATGRRSLTYSRRFLWTTCLVWVVANAAFSATIVLMKEDPPALVWGAGLFGLLWVAALAAAWDAFVTKLSVTEEGIWLQRGRAQRAFVPWKAVSNVRYSRLGSWFSFRAPGYPTVRVSLYRNGLGTLARCAERGMGRKRARKIPELLRRFATP